MPRGIPKNGTRKPGAGRPRKFGDLPTQVARVPVGFNPEEIYLKLEELTQLIDIWDSETEGATDSKRVRFSKARELVSQVQEIIGDIKL